MSDESLPAAWTKTPVPRAEVARLCDRYGVNPLSASIFARRGITAGGELLYFLESDLRFQHNPFLFNSMEDAVDRIRAAKEEGERVLIFGDRDVDGITSTALLFEELSSQGIDVSYKVPEGDETYGLSVAAVEEFAAAGGTLIITVDCGISNFDEIKRAGELGVSVIVLDHHEPHETLPDAEVIVDAKVSGAGYPFPEISACALAYKTVSALRFSASAWYKSDVALIDAREEGGAIAIDCVKTRNLAPLARFSTRVKPAEGDAFGCGLASFLEGEAVCCWDGAAVSRALLAAFGRGAEFSLHDLRGDVAKLHPAFSRRSLAELKGMSTLARYADDSFTELDALFSIFVTYVRQSAARQGASPVPNGDTGRPSRERDDLQLVALAALADVMPMRNENRLFVKAALAALNSGAARAGLRELAALLIPEGARCTSRDLSWRVIPALNACGRLGQAPLGVELFTEQDASRRRDLAGRIVALNQERRRLTSEALELTRIEAKDALRECGGKACVVFDERIHKGVAGIVAGRLADEYGVPAVVATKTATGVVIGSMRSRRGVDASAFLSQFEEYFSNYGGHKAAGGFTLKDADTAPFRARLVSCVRRLALSDEGGEGGAAPEVDAEVPAPYMARVWDIADRFEPYGEGNAPLVFMARNLAIVSGAAMGRGERTHLKITVDCGTSKWPCVAWGEGARWGREFAPGVRVDILFNVETNRYNGTETPQLTLLAVRRADRRPA